MKLKYWALSLLACGGMLSCSNNDDIVVDGPQDDDDVALNSSYMAVNLVMNNSGTRAVDDGGFVNGSEDESAIDVTKSVFLFYDVNGNYLTKGTISTENTDPSNLNGNYLVMKDETTGGNVERKSDAVIVLGPTTIKPSQMLAVLNAGSDALVGLSLSDAIASEVSSMSGSKGDFVMTNSSYVEGSNIVNATQLTDANVCETSDAALQNSVDIYVERVAAKLKVTESKTESELSGDDYILDNATGATMKVVIDGWCANAVNTSSYYVKNLDEAWIANAPFNGWMGTNRTFWAEDKNYTGTGVYPDGPTYSGLTYYSWNDATNANNAEVYLHENTINNTEATVDGGENTNVTTVLVKAHIEYKKSGESTYSRGNIYRWSGVYYTDEGLKDAIVASSGYYWYYEDGGQKHWQALNADEVTFDFPNPDDAATPGDVAIDITAITKPQIGSVAADNINLVKGNGSEQSVDFSTAMSDLEGSPYATGLTGYKNGACYYQVPIEHLSSTDGNEFYGVVRNHSYVMTINNITGIGGAIYDEDEDLPLIPGKDKNYYISATLSVLSWKVVNQSVTLD